MRVVFVTVSHPENDTFNSGRVAFVCVPRLPVWWAMSTVQSQDQEEPIVTGCLTLLYFQKFETFSSAPATGTLVVLSAGIGVDMEGEDVWHNSVT